MVATVRQPAPPFTAQALVNGEFTSISLDQFSGTYVVLVFYPADFSMVCPTELRALSDGVEEFHKRNVHVMACSVDSKFSHLAWSKQPREEGGLGKMNIPILSDLTKQISKDYGVLVDQGENAGVALRAAFIIDDKGIVRQATINDLPIGRNLDEILRLVDAIKYTDKHGEGCPANWHP